MRLAIEKQHKKYGNTVFIKPELISSTTSMTEQNDSEMLTVDIASRKSILPLWSQEI